MGHRPQSVLHRAWRDHGDRRRDGRRRQFRGFPPAGDRTLADADSRVPEHCAHRVDCRTGRTGRPAHDRCSRGAARGQGTRRRDRGAQGPLRPQLLRAERPPRREGRAHRLRRHRQAADDPCEHAVYADGSDSERSPTRRHRHACVPQERHQRCHRARGPGVRLQQGGQGPGHPVRYRAWQRRVLVRGHGCCAEGEFSSLDDQQRYSCPERPRPGVRSADDHGEDDAARDAARESRGAGDDGSRTRHSQNRRDGFAQTREFRGRRRVRPGSGRLLAG